MRQRRARRRSRSPCTGRDGRAAAWHGARWRRSARPKRGCGCATPHGAIAARPNDSRRRITHRGDRPAARAWTGSSESPRRCPPRSDIAWCTAGAGSSRHAHRRERSCAELRGLVHLAPLHLPPQIAAIAAVAARAPVHPSGRVLRHRLPPPAARDRAAPPAARVGLGEGICRFGFHGLSYEHVADILGAALRPGGDRPLATARAWRPCATALPIDTTMAFTPTAGLMMGTRPGDLDPGMHRPPRSPPRDGGPTRSNS